MRKKGSGRLERNWMLAILKYMYLVDWTFIRCAIMWNGNSGSMFPTQFRDRLDVEDEDEVNFVTDLTVEDIYADC